MKLEDCTKEELIWYIKTYKIYDEKELIFQVLLNRARVTSNLAYQAEAEACKALEQYTEALMPYEGCGYNKVPDKVIMNATRAFKEYGKYTEASNRYHHQYERIQKQIDKLL